MSAAVNLPSSSCPDQSLELLFMICFDSVAPFPLPLFTMIFCVSKPGTCNKYMPLRNPVTCCC